MFDNLLIFFGWINTTYTYKNIFGVIVRRIRSVLVRFLHFFIAIKLFSTIYELIFPRHLSFLINLVLLNSDIFKSCDITITFLFNWTIDNLWNDNSIVVFIVSPLHFPTRLSFRTVKQVTFLLPYIHIIF